MTKARGKVLNRTELATFYGVSLPTVDAWIRAGCPYIKRGTQGSQWRFSSADVHEWHMERARAEAGAPHAQDKYAIRLRKLNAEATLAELELAKAKQLVAPIAEMERVLTRACAEVQAKLCGPFVQRLAMQLIGETDERRFKRVALAEVREVLTSLANIDVTGFADEPDDESEENFPKESDESLIEHKD